MDDTQPTDPCSMCGDLTVVRVEPALAHGQRDLHPFCSLCGRHIPVRERPFQPNDRIAVTHRGAR